MSARDGGKAGKNAKLASLGARLALLVVAGAVEGILLASGPLLDQYAAVRLGPRGVFVDITLLCAAGMAALGAVAAFWPRLQGLFFLGLTVTVSWSLGHGSLHPWWVLDEETAWEAQPAGPALVAVHAACLALVCAALVLRALDGHRAASQGRPAAVVDREVARMRGRALLAVGLLAVAAVAAPLLLAALADAVKGSLPGWSGYGVLLGSMVLLTLGLGLLLAPERVRRKAKKTDDAVRFETDF
jgi:hypothetical protein